MPATRLDTGLLLKQIFVEKVAGALFFKGIKRLSELSWKMS